MPAILLISNKDTPADITSIKTRNSITAIKEIDRGALEMDGLLDKPSDRLV